MRHVLFAEDHLAPGSMIRVALDRTYVVVIRKENGEYRALNDRCPHAGARLSAGFLIPLAVADDVGGYRLADESVIQCSFHGYEFDPDTGRCPADPSHVRVRAYSVTIEEGQVILNTTRSTGEADSVERSAGGRAEASA